MKNSEANHKLLLNPTVEFLRGRGCEHFEAPWDSLSSASPCPTCLETLFHSQELLQTAALSENMLLLFTFSYFLLLSKQALEKGAGIWSMVLFCTSFIRVKVDIDFDTPKKWQTTTSVGERGQGKQSPCTLFCTHNRHCHYVNCMEVLKSKSRTFKCPRNVT